ncbi:hypothetical protein OHC33_007443 [Knufia fluminis]|uniref:Uncharacterized protein n=1 Tax=Knufia fluminis TaxID=191047 RepID=A0AAN8EI68_9EURO|nr:hypothetical protein OHC33_007443 [Knufia fluminis]
MTVTLIKNFIAMYFSALKPLAIALPLTGPILSVTARPLSSARTEINPSILPQRSTILQPMDKVERHEVEGFAAEPLPDYAWIADLEAIQYNNDTQMHQYDMGPEDLALFLSLSGYKLEDAIIETADKGADAAAPEEEQEPSREEKAQEEPEMIYPCGKERPFHEPYQPDKPIRFGYHGEDP